MPALRSAADAAVILLAGGLGTRVRHLRADVPKPLIDVAGKPFIDWVLDYFAGQGLLRTVVALGHMAEVAQEHLAKRGGDLRFSVERELLGTAGAIALAAQQAPEASVLVVANADSLVLADLAPALRMLEDPTVSGVIVGVEVADASRFGSLAFDENQRLTGFVEKRPGAGVINAGLYVLKREILEKLPVQRPLSLEREVFPRLLAEGVILRVLATRSPFIDMGTPESLAQAEGFVRQHIRGGG